MLGAMLGGFAEASDAQGCLADAQQQSVAVKDREQRLAEPFVELADTPAAHFDVIDFLQVVASRSVELLDVAAVGVLLADHSGALVTVAASDERARLLELFEIQNDERPCRDRYQLRAAVINVEPVRRAETLAAVRPAGDQCRVRLGQRAAVAGPQPGDRVELMRWPRAAGRSRPLAAARLPGPEPGAGDLRQGARWGSRSVVNLLARGLDPASLGCWFALSSFRRKRQT
jgi:hypothetical protein